LRGVTWSVTHDPQGPLTADGSGTPLGSDNKSGTQVGGSLALPLMLPGADLYDESLVG
jgi:hypothetical protein